jgi:hypothetical protein
MVRGSGLSCHGSGGGGYVGCAGVVLERRRPMADSGSAVLGRGGGVVFMKLEDEGGRSRGGGRVKGALAGILEKRDTS